MIFKEWLVKKIKGKEIEYVSILIIFFVAIILLFFLNHKYNFIVTIATYLSIAVLLAIANRKSNQSDQGKDNQYKKMGITLAMLAAELISLNDAEKAQKEAYLENFIQSKCTDYATIMAMHRYRSQMTNLTGIEKCCQGMRYQPHAERLIILHQLFKIATIDKEYNEAEDNLLKAIGKHLQISTKNFNFVKSKFIKDNQKEEFILDPEVNQKFVDLFFKKDNSWAYDLLGLLKNATNEQIKKTYHQLALNFHPDKLSGSSEIEQKIAEHKFQEINEAYEIIKSERGIN